MALYEKTGGASALSGSLLHEMPDRRKMPSVTRCQSVRCITIHACKIHQRDSEAFSGGKTCGFASPAAKSRTGRFSGARNGTLW